MRLFWLELGAVTDEVVARSRGTAPNYRHVGSTLWSGLHPAAPWPHAEIAQVEGGGQGFDAAKQALRSWRPQRAIGATVDPPGVRPDLGETVLFSLGVGRARLLVPTRIVTVVDEPDRYGYAYGTLPGHPLRGEELFLVERMPDSLLVTIRVQAEPTDALRFLAPLSRRLQRLALRRYRAALQRAAVQA